MGSVREESALAKTVQLYQRLHALSGRLTPSTMADWMTVFKECQRAAQPLHPRVPWQDFHNAFLISSRYGYLFTNVPKVACTTIRKLLIDAEFGVVESTEERMDTIYFKEFLPFLNILQLGDIPTFLGRTDVYRFCFVRNPYTRLLSAYLDKIVRGKAERDPILKQLGISHRPDTELSFETFVKAVQDQPVLYQDHHWRVQYYQSFQEGINYDFIGRFESFDADLDAVARRLGMTEYLRTETHRNGSRKAIGQDHATGADGRIAEFYTPELQELVFKIYRKDFDYFGYGEALPIRS